MKVIFTVQAWPIPIPPHTRPSPIPGHSPAIPLPFSRASTAVDVTSAADVVRGCSLGRAERVPAKQVRRRGCRAKRV
ncbi:hypothetical protein RI054_21g94130 [Pseudoscourfieldia marina]